MSQEKREFVERESSFWRGGWSEHDFRKGRSVILASPFLSFAGSAEELVQGALGAQSAVGKKRT
jgi:hypothetical protein